MTAHSASSYKNHHCRCQACRQAHTAQQYAIRRARFAAREDIGGALIAVAVPEENHGRASTYRNYGCKCEACCAAETEKKAERRRRRNAA